MIAYQSPPKDRHSVPIVKCYFDIFFRGRLVVVLVGCFGGGLVGRLVGCFGGGAG